MEFDASTLTPEDIFSMVLLNQKRKIKVTAELRDKDGNSVPLAEVITDLIQYINDKVGQDEDNNFNSQIYPLMAQAMASTLSRIVGIGPTGFYIAQNQTRTAFIYSMCVAFMLLKYVQQHGLTIHTTEEQVDEEEIESINRKSRANEIITMASFMGLSYKQVIKLLMKKGQLSEAEAEEMLGASLSTLDDVDITDVDESSIPDPSDDGETDV
jgi:hypothetical protein